MATPNFDLPEIAQSQAQKEVTHNDALLQLDSILGSTVSLDLTSGNIVLTVSDLQVAREFLIINAIVVGRTITLPDTDISVVFNSFHQSSIERVDIVKGTVSRTIYPGELVRIRPTTTINMMIEEWNNRVPMNWFHLGGLPASVIVGAWEITNSIFWFASPNGPDMAHLLRPRSSIALSPGPPFILEVQVNGITVVEFEWGNGDSVGDVSFIGANNVTLRPGDRLTLLTGNNPQNLTDLSFSLTGFAVI